MTTSADNAEKMEASMVRELNRARQQRITDEVLEVVSGAEALG
jgi:F0F1-type ATP synthase gamma subunit